MKLENGVGKVFTLYISGYLRIMAAKALYLVGIFLLIVALRVFVFEFYQVESRSMEDTFLEGDVVWLSKLQYGARLPTRPGDVPFLEALAYVLGFHSWTQTTNWDYHRVPGVSNIARNDIVIFTDPHNRENNLIKRCVALPGDTFMIKHNDRYVNGIQQVEYSTEKFSFRIKLKGHEIPIDTLARYGLDGADILWRGDNDVHASMTWCELEGFKNCTQVDSIFINDFPQGYPGGSQLFPASAHFPFTFENYGAVIIPAKGETVKLDTINIAFYKEVIENYEHNQLEIDSGKIRINTLVTDSYTFKFDYFFLMGDNRYHSFDSRQWGFVPESAIIGKVGLVLFSYNKYEKGFDKIRTHRMFKSINGI